MPHDLPSPAAIMALAGTGPRIPYPSDTIRLLFSCLRCSTQHQTTIAMLPYERKAEVQCWACYAHEEIQITPNDNRIDVYIRWLRHQRHALVRAEALANLRPGCFLCDDCDQPHRDHDHPDNFNYNAAAGERRPQFRGRGPNAAGRARVAASGDLERVRCNAAAIYSEESEDEDEDENVELAEQDEAAEEQENVEEELREGYWPAVEDVYGI